MSNPDDSTEAKFPTTIPQFTQTPSQYKKIRTIGVGSFGCAILVQRVTDGKLFVLKKVNVDEMSLKERADALNEVRILSKLKHHNIIDYHESFLRDGHLNIVMDYASEGDLHHHIQYQGSLGKPFPESQVMLWFGQILLGLHHVHNSNILHRDLKTQNIFLMDNGVVKLGDFGVSKVLLKHNDYTKTMIGTPYYLPPELCDDQPYNSKGDIWSLGCVLYEICTFKHAFNGTSLPALMLKILKGKYAPLPACYSRDLHELVRDVLQKDPGQRPSAAELLERDYVQHWLTEFSLAIPQGVRASPSTTTPAQSRPLPAEAPPAYPGNEPTAPDIAQWLARRQADLDRMTADLMAGRAEGRRSSLGRGHGVHARSEAEPEQRAERNERLQQRRQMYLKKRAEAMVGIAEADTAPDTDGPFSPALPRSASAPQMHPRDAAPAPPPAATVWRHGPPATAALRSETPGKAASVVRPGPTGPQPHRRSRSPNVRQPPAATAPPQDDPWATRVRGDREQSQQRERQSGRIPEPPPAAPAAVPATKPKTREELLLEKRDREDRKARQQQQQTELMARHRQELRNVKSRIKVDELTNAFEGRRAEEEVVVLIAARTRDDASRCRAEQADGDAEGRSPLTTSTGSASDELAATAERSPPQAPRDAALDPAAPPPFRQPTGPKRNPRKSEVAPSPAVQPPPAAQQAGDAAPQRRWSLQKDRTREQLRADKRKSMKGGSAGGSGVTFELYLPPRAPKGAPEQSPQPHPVSQGPVVHGDNVFIFINNNGAAAGAQGEATRVAPDADFRDRERPTDELEDDETDDQEELQVVQPMFLRSEVVRGRRPPQQDPVAPTAPIDIAEESQDFSADGFNMAGADSPPSTPRPLHPPAQPVAAGMWEQPQSPQTPPASYQPRALFSSPSPQPAVAAPLPTPTPVPFAYPLLHRATAGDRAGRGGAAGPLRQPRALGAARQGAAALLPGLPARAGHARRARAAGDNP